MTKKKVSGGKANLFVAGSPKTGTTTLYEYFKEHPEVEVPKKKEPHFFAKDLHRQSDSFHGYQVSYPIRKMSQYKQLYSFLNKKYKADLSTHYFISEEAAENIFNYNPNAKIIIFLRESVDFLKSYHKQRLVKEDELINNFKKALDMEEKRKKDYSLIPLGCSYPKKLFYSEWVQYRKNIERFLNIFPRKQINIIIYDDFKEDNQKVLHEIFDFLGIKRIKITEKQVNTRKGVKYMNLRKLFFNNYSKKFARTFFPSFLKRFSIDFVNNITLGKSKRTGVEPRLRKKLMQKYKQEVIILDELLHKHGFVEKDKNLVKLWGYDKLA